MTSVFSQQNIFRAVAFLGVGVALFAPVFVFAQGGAPYSYTPFAEIPGFSYENASFGDLVNRIYLTLIAVGAVFGVLKIALAGIKYSTSDVVSSKQQALSDIKGIFFGLALLLIPYIVLNTINPNLTNLNVFDNGFGDTELPGTTTGNTDNNYGNDPNWEEEGAKGDTESQQSFAKTCLSNGSIPFYSYYEGELENSREIGCAPPGTLTNKPGCNLIGTSYTCVYTKPGTQCALSDTDCIARCQKQIDNTSIPGVAYCP